ncbi:MAG TPA: hypothetical protein VF765_29395 [Polyangiaceae bacterium]
MRILPSLVLGIGCTFAAGHARADTILPAPGTTGVDAQLATLATGFQLQQDVFATAENGLSLDVVFNAGDVATVRSFFAQTASTDFRQVTGKHPFAVVQTFGEWGDEGNFAGVASVGVAARLMVLKKSGAPEAEITAARNAAIRAAQTWHVWGSIGGPGVVARGVRRVTPLNPSDPPLPGMVPQTVPLKDASGNPQPTPKQPTWRAPVASGDSDWIWFDDTSKDQVIGFALAVTWLYDALKGDPAVPSDVLPNLAADMKAFASSLQKVAPELGIDLCIRDADGRLTDFHDLNPRELSPGHVLPPGTTLRNGFNALLALAVIRAAYHVTADPDIGAYYYQDLVGTRGMQDEVAQTSGAAFLGVQTNYSNVGMLAIAYATLMRVETDPRVRAAIGGALETAFWNTGDTADGNHTQQAWYDAIYGAFAPAAVLHDASLRSRIQNDLSGFQPAPAIERDIVNCTPADIDAGSCIGIDGKTMITLVGNAGGSPVAKDIVPMPIRPDSDFEWRSDPHQVNGTGSTLMDPRGDWLAAYWLARLADEDVTKNVSPNALPPLPWGGGDDAGAEGGAGAAAGGGGSSGGCGCTAAGTGGCVAALGFVGGLAAGLAARRRRTVSP